MPGSMERPSRHRPSEASGGGEGLLSWRTGGAICFALAGLLAIPACAGGAQGEAGSSPAAPREGGEMKGYVKPSDEEIRKRLTPTQYQVTQKEGTEPAFRNEYWNNKQPGLYVDVVSGEPLFSSLDKYDSGTGWPSFTRPLEPDALATHEDRTLGMSRVEVRSRQAGSHLGHLFDDGPAPTGQRYCMNSAALRFVPVERLAAEGYGKYLPLFAAPGVPAARKGNAPDGKPGRREVALLAGGCFWGMQEIIRKIPGVLATEVGYTGGKVPHATYEQVKSGRTGHAESIRVVFDPDRLSYEDLLGWFFRMHDPTTPNRQGNDTGAQYRSAIFYIGEAQRKTAEAVKARVDASGKWKRPIVTEIVPASDFWPAEDYHQDYLEKNPGGYTCHFLRD